MFRCASSRAIDKSPHAAWAVLQVTLMLAAALIGWGGVEISAAGQVSELPAAVSPNTLTPERIRASVAAVVGLVGAVVGGLALARSTRHRGTGNGRRAAVVAVVLGPIGLAIGGLIVATADGGVGTGNGVAGGVVAMMMGLIGMTLGGLALARSRRTA